jgi:acetyltransferase-like isoleucine patch superfamily enzyme
MKEFNYSELNKMGSDVYISVMSEIRRPHLANIGKHVAIDSGFYCTTQLAIGDYVHISPQVTVIGGPTALLKVGNFTTIGAGSRLICGSDSFMGDGLMGYGIPDEYKDEITIAPITLSNFASIATQCVILPGVTIAEGSVIGACSLVTKNTEPWTIYAGVPARPIKIRPKDKMIEYAKKLGYL